MTTEPEDELDQRLRRLEREVAERAHLIHDCTGLRERVASIETQLHPLLGLSAQLTLLSSHVGELKAELGQLRIQKVVSSGSKLNKIHDLRKSIARVLTVINAKQRSQLRLFYKNKKYAPLDLRPKQTRAIRRRLSPEDKARVLEKAKKRETHFPQRKFAIKA